MSIKQAQPPLSMNGDQTVSAIFTTTNYDMFKLMDSNRDINELHVRRLIESFKEEYLICPIIVNEKREIIDGQHRWMAAKEIGLPLYYFRVHGYGIKEVRILNTNQKNWQRTDYLQMYCEQNKTPYLQFRKFMEDYPDFKMQASERILKLRSAKQSETLGGHKTKMRDFEEGKFNIPDIKKSYSLANKLMDFKPFFPEFHTAVFVSSVMPLILRSKVYKHNEMIYKLGICPIKLRVCKDVQAYRDLMEEIYNYKRLKENKVSFRYE